MKDIIEVLSHAYTMDIITDVEFAQLVAEDDALRDSVEQAERERDAARAGHDYAIEEQKKSTAYISELLSERDNKADSLNAWAELWAHIVKRLGGDDGTLPTTANFDALLVARGSGFARSMIDDFKRERDELAKTLSEIREATYMPDGSRLSDEFIRVVRERDEARAQLAQADALAESDTLTPRRCGTCCTEAAKAMRESAKEVSDKFANAKRMKLPGPFGGLHDPDENGFETVSPYVGWTARSISSEINALPLPSCEGCNPLKPEAAK